MTLQKKQNINWDHIIIFLYYLIYICTTLTMIFVQPLGDAPDELGRNAITQYIWYYKQLPTGFEESIRIEGYGFSYAFQPILPYIIQALAMQFVTLFHPTSMALLYTARLVNFLFGLIMAHFVLELSRIFFEDKGSRYLFAFFVMFLPQCLYMHTYVNTDSCNLMSIAIMLTGLFKGVKDHFSFRSSLTLAIGIILCALSYYNSYGFILSSILLFITFYLHRNGEKIRLDWKPLLWKGIFISFIVLAGISWWFIRSYILYDGDFLGLKTRDLCAIRYALPSVNPLTRVTYQNQGYSIWQMLMNSDFFQISIQSLICAYGPMTVVTYLWLYRFYKLIILLGFLGLLLPRKKTGASEPFFCERPVYSKFVHINMLFCLLMPWFLSIIYSYTTDFQPQGRYLLPSLIPMVFFTVRGLHKAVSLMKKLLSNFTKNKPSDNTLPERLAMSLYFFLCTTIVLGLVLTIYFIAVPYYITNF